MNIEAYNLDLLRRLVRKLEKENQNLTESSKSPAGLRRAISSGWGLACIRRGTSPS